MQENREAGEPWIAIDDQGTWFAPNCPNLLSTDPAFGFSQDDRETLGGMLAVITA